LFGLFSSLDRPATTTSDGLSGAGPAHAGPASFMDQTTRQTVEEAARVVRVMIEIARRDQADIKRLLARIDTLEATVRELTSGCIDKRGDS
jgi:hypothetical protein